MEADCQWKNLVWRLSPSRGLGRKITEQDRTDRRSKAKTKVDALIDILGFFIITVEIAQMEMLIAKHTPLCGSGASWAP